MTTTHPEPQWRTVYAIWTGAPVCENGPRGWTFSGQLPTEDAALGAAAHVAQAMRCAEGGVQVRIVPMRTCLPATKRGSR